MLYAKKSLGQNYLIDLNIINKIVNILDIKNKNVIEIGPGKGALTEIILSKNPKSLIVIEKDNKLSENLKFKYHKNKKINIFNEDILKFNLEDKIKKNSIIFGNLPYNISSQILVKFIRFKNWPPVYKDIIFMFQKELGEKIIGRYPSKDYGRKLKSGTCKVPHIINPKKTWGSVLFMSGVERHMKIHSTRHTFATNFYRVTRDIKALADALGTTEAQALKYAKLVNETVVDGINKIKFFDDEKPILKQVN